MTSPREKVWLACWGIPLLLLVASYVWLAVDHGTLRLWNVVVHESGRYTLKGTVLYFGHFLRELPTVAAYTLFLLGSSGAVQSGISNLVGSRPTGSTVLPRRMGWAALVLAGVLVTAALLETARLQGWESAFLDLAQYRTRDDLVGYGTHWRYHWLSTLWFGAAVGVAPALANRVTGRRALGTHDLWRRLAWAWFVALTLVFGLSRDVFLDARYAGHQAREILTHGPVTLLLGIGILLAVQPREAPPHTARNGVRRPVLAVSAALALLVPAYLAVVALSGDVMAQGQSGLGLSAMVGAHYFEHTLDYVLILLLLAAGLALGPGPRRD